MLYPVDLSDMIEIIQGVKDLVFPRKFKLFATYSSQELWAGCYTGRSDGSNKGQQ